MRKVFMMMTTAALLLSCGGGSGSRGRDDRNQAAIDYMVAYFTHDFQTQKQLVIDELQEEIDDRQKFYEEEFTEEEKDESKKIEILNVSVTKEGTTPNSLFVVTEFQYEGHKQSSENLLYMEQGEDGKWYVTDDLGLM